MVDQEGGRVARLRPPHWRAHKPAAAIGALYEQDRTAGLRAAWLTGALIGLDCAAAGFDVVAAPVLDLAIDGASSVVGDRSFGAAPLHVARLGRALATGLMATGILPVMKHAPGHGRALVDSHAALPVVTDTDLDVDILPFILNADLPWAMTAHIVYSAWDGARPATLSRAVIEGVIRGRIGFRGVLLSDDLAMNALSGEPAERACASLAAGCDIALYCSGGLAQSAALLAEIPPITPEAARRFAASRAVIAGRRIELDGNALAAERERLLG